MAGIEPILDFTVNANDEKEFELVDKLVKIPLREMTSDQSAELMSYYANFESQINDVNEEIIEETKKYTPVHERVEKTQKNFEDFLRMEGNNALLENNPLIVTLGESGSGKTTICNRLCGDKSFYGREGPFNVKYELEEWDIDISDIDDNDDNDTKQEETKENKNENKEEHTYTRQINDMNTDDVQIKQVIINKTKLTILDIPTLNHFKGFDVEWTAYMTRIINLLRILNVKVCLFIICINMGRLKYFLEYLDLLHDGFGKNIWKNVAFCITSVEDDLSNDEYTRDEFAPVRKILLKKLSKMNNQDLLVTNENNKYKRLNLKNATNFDDFNVIFNDVYLPVIPSGFYDNDEYPNQIKFFIKCINFLIDKCINMNEIDKYSIYDNVKETPLERIYNNKLKEKYKMYKKLLDSIIKISTVKTFPPPTLPDKPEFINLLTATPMSS